MIRKSATAKIVKAAREYEKAAKRHDKAQSADPGHQVSTREIDQALRAWRDAKDAATAEENNLANRIID